MKKILLVVLAFYAFGVQAQTIIYSNNCNNLTGWTNTGGKFLNNLTPVVGTFDWYAVTPTIPAGDHTGGGGCFFTEGNSNYALGGTGSFVLYRIESPSIDLSGYSNCTLSFWMYLNCETNGWDGAHMEAYNGTSWVPITNAMLSVPYDGNISRNPSSGPTYNTQTVPAWFNLRNTWTQVNVNLASFNGISNFRLRFVFLSDEGTNGRGWGIDDVSISIPASTAVPISFWAVVGGLFLIGGLTIYRMRKKLIIQ
jgi:hypothetical protein